MVLDTAPLVGRDLERKTLLDGWNSMRDGGRGRAALIVGKPGIGKSRLATFIKDVSSRTGGTPLQGICSDYYSGRSFHVLGRMLDRKCETRGLVDQTEKLTALRNELAQSGADVDSLTPFLAPLMGIAPDAGYVRPQLDATAYLEATRSAVSGWWAALAAKEPMVVVVEDLQWSDSSSLDLISNVVDPQFDPFTGAMKPGLPQGVFLVLTSRLASSDRGTDSGHASALHRIATSKQADHIELEPLSSERTAELVAALDPNRAIGEDRLATIVARSEGNPMYVEQSLEISQTALDEEQIPETLPELLKRRVDSLAPADRELAQLASVIGRAIDIELLAAVAGRSTEEVVPGLQRLVGRQILTTGDIGDYVQFAFRHDLIVEEVYNSADRAVRQTTHSALADAVLSGVGTDLDPAVAAKHLDKAGRQVEAVGQYATAALTALGAGASRVAVDVLDRALEIVSRWESGPETSVTEMSLHLLRGTGWTAIEGYASPNALSEYTAVHRIAAELGSGLESATALLSLIAFHTVVGNRAEAETLIGDLYKLSEEAGPAMASAFDAELHYNSSFHEFFIGDYEASAREYDRALAIFEARPDGQKVFPGVPPPSDTLTGTLANAAPVEWVQGRMSRAEEMIRQGIERSRGQTFPVGPFMECYTRAYAGWMYAVAGLYDEAAEQYGAMLQLASKHGYGMWVGFAGIHGLITELHLEVTPERVAQLEGARQIAAATGIRSFQPYFLTEQAWLTGRMGDTERAFEMFAQALATGEEMNERFYEAETLRKRAELFSADDRHDSAAADLANALETASSQGAYVYRLRAALDLARLPDALRPGDVRDGLTEAIGLIAEPDRYPEVKDAKELLARV